MPGMNSGLNSGNTALEAAFRATLLRQGIIALLIFAILAVAWVGAREWVTARGWPRAGAVRVPRTDDHRDHDSARTFVGRSGAGQPNVSEPAWRRLVRIGFGILWIFDGLLQAQPAMAGGLPSQVIRPAAAGSPAWVQHMVSWAAGLWVHHPIQAGAAAVWIQVGIGMWLLAAARGPASRLAGLACAGWGLVVWVFGEAFGGIFGPGLTWLFGAPGAAIFYCAAGALIALPERGWRTPRLGRRMVAVTGLFFGCMAVLQAWPRRGFWQGTLHHHAGTLTPMIRSMAATPQPALIAGWERSLASFVAGHGFAVNLIAVIALVVIGASLVSVSLVSVSPVSASPVSAAQVAGQRRLLRLSIVCTVALWLADWLLIEDLGFFGGLGTDPNTMIPMALLVVAGYLALVAGPALQPEAAPASGGSRDRVRPARLLRTFGTAGTSAVLAVWAVGVIVLGAAPMAVAQASPHAAAGAERSP